MYISVALIFYGSIALYMGTSYIRKENNNRILRICLSLSGIYVFLWCFGYGMMGLSKTAEACLLWRSIGLFGVIFYLVNNFVYVRYFTGTLKEHFGIVMSFVTIFAIITFNLVKSPEVVTFFEYNGRMAYKSHPCLGRTVESVYLVFIVSLSMALGIIKYAQAKYKRTKKAILIIIAAHMAIVLLMIPDTLFPMLGMVSLPTTGFGAFICYLCIMYVSDSKAAFSISTNIINEFIFKDLDSSLLFFGPDGNLLAANNHAKSYLNLYGKTVSDFTDIFDISKSEVVEMLKGNRIISDNGIGVKIKNSDRICSASVTKILDRYGEPFYYACALNDITNESRAFTETQNARAQLDKEVKAKTREIEMLSLQTIETMANALEAKDEYTRGHSSRVSEYSVLLAEKLGYSEEAIENMRIMALLHDVGKIAVPDRVLNKAGKLEDDEFEIIKSHTTQGYNLLKGISALGPVANVARHHHERFDGKGYPDHLAGDSIEIEARIVGIADAYDAMSSDRVYRKALPKSVIRDELLKGRGTQFDPDLLDAFMELFNEGALDLRSDGPALSENVLDLKELVQNIKAEGDHDGASIISNQELIRLYSYLIDRYDRYGSSFKIILITLNYTKEGTVEAAALENAMKAMEYSIVQHLRKTDLSSRVSASQHIVILTEADEAYLSSIVERIFAGYYRNCLYTDLKPSYEAGS